MKSRRKLPDKVIEADGFNCIKAVTRIWAAIASMVILAAALTSCNNTGCNDNRSSIPLAGFYDAASGKAIQLQSIDIGGVGAPGDSLLLTAAEKATMVYLPLRQTSQTASFFIAYRDEALDFPQFVDTIEFKYNSIPFFASEECGAMYRYRITSLRYTTHILERVEIIPADSLITNLPEENIRLYFRTTAGEGDEQ